MRYIGVFLLKKIWEKKLNQKINEKKYKIWEKKFGKKLENKFGKNWKTKKLDIIFLRKYNKIWEKNKFEKKNLRKKHFRKIKNIYKISY